MYMLFFGGGSPPDSSLVPDAQEVRKAVADTGRQEKALAILGEMKSAEQSLLAAYDSRHADLTALSSRHDAGVEEFREVLVGLEKTRLASREAWLDGRFGLREQMTPAEWEKVYGGR